MLPLLVTAVLATSASGSVFDDAALFPRVDLSKPRHEIIRALRQAADIGGPGFFYLMNHGIEASVFDNTIRELHRYFSFPLKKKLNISAAGYGGGTVVTKGYVPARAEGAYPKDTSDARPEDEKSSGKKNTREALLFRYPEEQAVQHEKYMKNYTEFLEQLTETSATSMGGRPQSRLSHPSNRVARTEDEVVAGARLFFKTNQWPSPEDVPSFRGAVERYMSEIKNVHHLMIDLFFHAMEPESERHLRATSSNMASNMTSRHMDVIREKAMTSLNFVHYPPLKVGNEDLGISDHTDWEFFTLLYPSYLQAKHVDACNAPSLSDLATDECAALANETGAYHTGLEVWFQDKWSAVPRIPGAILVNQGEMLSRLSHGRFKAPVHRVLAQNPFERYSLISFWAPNYEFLLPDPDLPCGQVLAGEHYLKRNALLERAEYA